MAALEAVAALEAEVVDLDPALQLLVAGVVSEEAVLERALRPVAEEEDSDREAVGLALALGSLLLRLLRVAVVLELLLDSEAGERRRPRRREEPRVALELSPLEEATTRAALEGVSEAIRLRPRQVHLDLVVVLAPRLPHLLSRVEGLGVAAVLAHLQAAALREGSNHLLVPLARLLEEEEALAVVVAALAVVVAAALALSQRSSSRISPSELVLVSHRNLGPTSLRGKKRERKK